MSKFSREIEVSGHLIDSLILTKIFDVIMDLNGEFQVLEINIGKKKKDTSYAKLLVQAKNQKQLDQILEYVYRLGATAKLQKEVKLKKAPKNMLMPENFYSTTNNHTQIFYKKRWISVGNMMMDKCIVVSSKG
ncbi:MAG: TIGR00300 family protein, partial [Nitrososphaerota archaeon]|nr:TIGR00300 family protein [Nitrososphaerota archaeon]